MTLASYSIEKILLKRRGLRARLLAQANLQDIRIAVLGGTTTNEVVDLLELLLLDEGFRPAFLQSEYGRYYEDAVLEPHMLADFRPDLVYLHTCSRNMQNIPPLGCREEDFTNYVDAEMRRFGEAWASLTRNVGCQIIQNNFELPPGAHLGNLDAVSAGGASRFILELNRQFAMEVRSNPHLYLQDLCALAAQLGGRQWFDADRWFSYKIAHTVEASFAIANSLAAMIRAMYGRTRKVLVLDLDNTLWGGVIGDDGPDRIALGRETPLGEAFTAFQEYCLSLRERGILLAVCSKNDEAVARLGFAHPDAVLQLEHFSSFKANWEPKHENILAIARELNLGIDSFVFVDDNPAERALVEAQLPAVAVPNVGSEVTQFAATLDAARYFEVLSVGEEDRSRARLYEEDAERAKLEQKFASYGDYLDSLYMTAEIAPFHSMYMERIAQLTNKSNQFNLTTRRYTLADIQATVGDGRHIGLYGKLTDRFGDNGLISVVLGRLEGQDLHVDLWLMSCRVLKREMELAMLDSLVVHAARHGVRTVYGYYLPTPKNGMVSKHYDTLGFAPVSKDEQTGATMWRLDLMHYEPRSRHIAVLEPVHV